MEFPRRLNLGKTIWMKMSQLKEMEFEKGKNQMICGLGKMENFKKIDM
jgi:hypothetical protein